MHFKYSAVLNVVYVTMMYGLGLPILFPYAVLAIFILWFTEKLMFFYTYRLPPAYDASLGKHVIEKMRYAPLIMMLFGYWFFSSNQLLANNELTEIMRQSDTPITKHTFA